MAGEPASRGADSICIKDMAGLIMPAAARDLITGIRETTGLPVCLHSHSTSGIASMSYQAAIDAGVDILDTAMSPFALGTSQPPTESVVASLAGTDRDTGIDLLTLREARNACLALRDRYGALVDPISERVDSDVLIYQLPGGMISNLVSQLKEQDALDRLDEVFAEVPRVRKDLGYPAARDPDLADCRDSGCPERAPRRDGTRTSPRRSGTTSAGSTATPRPPWTTRSAPGSLPAARRS